MLTREAGFGGAQAVGEDGAGLEISAEERGIPRPRGVPFQSNHAHVGKSLDPLDDGSENRGTAWKTVTRSRWIHSRSGRPRPAVRTS